MSEAVLHIKNMVCPRCVEAVQGILESEQVLFSDISLGKAQLSGPLADSKMKSVQTRLEERGFELVIDEDQVYTELIKAEIVKLIHHSESVILENNSDYLSSRLNTPYYRLGKAFKSSTGLTIEKYIINQKIERVKELISYNELSATQIAYDLGYSSLQHLSNQFKSTTGYSLRDYKALEVKDRRNLDAV